MPFCRNCQVEYKGNVSVCPECGEHLTGASLDELEEMEAQHGEKMICFYRSTSRDNSDTLIDALTETEIKYTFKPVGRSSSNTTGAISEIYDGHFIDGEFFVREDDYDAAREIVESVLGDVDDEFE